MAGDRFEGKGVIVTGGAQGIGRAIVDAFVAEGAHVVAVDILARRLDGMGRAGHVDTIAADLGDEASRCGPWCRARRAAGTRGRPGELRRDAARRPRARRHHRGVRRHGRRQRARAVHPHAGRGAGLHGRRRRGAIVNIASANAIRNESPESIYNASKASLIAFTTAFAHEFAHLGVRVNAVAPGETMTPEAEAEMTQEDRVVEREYLARIPMRRVGRPHEQAAAVLFLASTTHRSSRAAPWWWTAASCPATGTTGAMRRRCPTKSLRWTRRGACLGRRGIGAGSRRGLPLSSRARVVDVVVARCAGWDSP